MKLCPILFCSLLISSSFQAALAQDYRERDLSGANLQGATIKNLDLTDSNFDDANLSRANLESAKGERTLFRRANLAATNFRSANFPGGQFQRAQASGADFTGANLQGASFAGANLSEANFEKANLNNADFRGAKTDGANFKGAKIGSALFDTAAPDIRSRKPQFQTAPSVPAQATRSRAVASPPLAVEKSPDPQREPRSILKTVGRVLWPFGGSSQNQNNRQEPVRPEAETAASSPATVASSGETSIQPEERKYRKATLVVKAVAIDQGNLPVNALRIEIYDPERNKTLGTRKTNRDGQTQFKKPAGRRYILRPLPGRDKNMIVLPVQIDFVLPPEGAIAKFVKLRR